MNDLDLFKDIIQTRLTDLEKSIIDTGSGCEMGMSPDFVKRQFNFTRKQLGLQLEDEE